MISRGQFRTFHQSFETQLLLIFGSQALIAKKWGDPGQDQILMNLLKGTHHSAP
jgi:hypothetical protein